MSSTLADLRTGQFKELIETVLIKLFYFQGRVQVDHGHQQRRYLFSPEPREGQQRAKGICQN